MKKRRIVIASLLKPVNDTRMLEKMALTLDGIGKFDVSIIGYPTDGIPVKAHIRFYPIRPFNRLSWKRLFAPWQVMRIIHEVKPEVLIVNTHELLIVAALYRIFFGAKIIYDIRENYYLNILHTTAFPWPLRFPIAAWVRLKEWVTSPFFNHFFLAETGYRKEMSFYKRRVTVLENKAVLPEGLLRTSATGKIRLLFTGTLDHSTGVFEAISLAKALHSLNPDIQLKLVGRCAIPAALQRIWKAIDGHPYIELHGGDQLVPHEEIVTAIYASDFGIVCYPPSPHTQHSIPTKFYEYMAAGLPMLLQDRPQWLALALPFRACIPVNFSNIDPQTVLLKMNGPFYTTTPTDVTWESEARKLVEVMEGFTT